MPGEETPTAVTETQPATPFGSMGDPSDFPGVTPSDATVEPASDGPMGSVDDMPGVRAPASETGMTGVAGAVGGLAEGTGLSAGATTGFKLGMRLPIPHPLLKGVVTGLTTIGGGLYGMWAGHQAKAGLSEYELPSGDPLAYKHIDDVPPRLRSSYIFGENIGYGASFTGLQIGLAKTGAQVLQPSFVGKVFNGIMDEAKNRTKRFAFGQMVQSAGAGVGGMVAEEAFPGELAPRVAMETTGGIVAQPGKIVFSAGKYLMERVGGFAKTFSPAAVETEAARIIQSAYVTSGDDIVAAARILRDNIKNHPDLVATVAQQVGDDPMIGLEKALISESKEVSIEAGRRAQATVDMFRDTIRLLHGTGQPEALKMAADLQRRHFTMLMTNRINAANQKSIDAASELMKAGSGTRSEIALKAYDAAAEALAQSRTAEKTLWGKVPGELDASTRSLEVAFKAMKGLRLNNQPMPDLIVKELAGFTEAGSKTTVGYLKIFRSQMLKEARMAGSNPERASEAAMYGRMAEAALDDIDMVFKDPNTAGTLRTLGFDTEAYDTARSFSAALHAAFTNSFTGKNLAKGAQGLRLAPEGLMKRAFAGGAEVSDARLSELAEATRFLPSKGMGGPEAEQAAELMLEAQQEYFAIAAADLAGVKHGPARIKMIEQFIAKNPELKERFPDVVNMLEKAATTQAGADAVASLHKKAGRIVEQRSAWGTLSGKGKDVFESPIDAVAAGLSGRTPVRSFTAMARLATKQGVDSEAAMGFKATVFDHALREATDASGTVDFQRMRNLLFDPLRPGKGSVVEIMERTGTMDEVTKKALTTILDRADTLHKAQTTTGAFVETTTTTDFLTQAIAKMLGSKAATTAAGPGGGHSIIVAGVGAKLGDRLVNAIPSGKVKDLLIEATHDPELMVLLMEKPVSGVKGLEHWLQLHSMMVGLGIIPVTPLALGAGDIASEITQ